MAPRMPRGTARTAAPAVMSSVPMMAGPMPPPGLVLTAGRSLANQLPSMTERPFDTT
jgi:hypothetical protein